MVGMRLLRIYIKMSESETGLVTQNITDTSVEKENLHIESIIKERNTREVPE